MRKSFQWKITVISVLFLLVIGAQAQDDVEDLPLTLPISYQQTIAETITDDAFFDWWQLEVTPGDIIVVEMEASDGLIPLLGLLDSDGDLVARSDEPDIAEVNGRSLLNHTAGKSGTYTIIATRDGRDKGTTTGSYTLTVINNRSDIVAPINPFMEVEFRCKDWLMSNALTFEFREDVVIGEDVQPGERTEFYRVSVYGLDGFEPIIRMFADVIQDGPLDCTDSPQATEGTSLELPFLDEPYEVTEDDAKHVAMVTLNNTGQRDPLGDIIVNIGAREGTSGRFIVVLEGMGLQVRGDVDEFFVRRGPFASDNPLDIYMIGNADNRLDPYMEYSDVDTGIQFICDDVGRGDCRILDTLTDARITMGTDNQTYLADRFDAGVRVDLDDNPTTTVKFQSRDDNTTGGYTVIFYGELPAR